MQEKENNKTSLKKESLIDKQTFDTKSFPGYDTPPPPPPKKSHVNKENNFDNK